MTFPHALRSPVFVTSLAVLLVNDFYLKAQFGNWVTGKLSDFAGLFAFAYFWSAVFPRHGRAVHVATGVAFVIWKSPLPEPLLQMWNAVSPVNFGRVTDVTDLMALAVLPVSYWMHQRILSTPIRVPSFATLAQGIAIAAISLFAFVATSQSPRTVIFEASPDESALFRFQVPKEQLVTTVAEVVTDSSIANVEVTYDGRSVDYALRYASEICGYRITGVFQLHEEGESSSALRLEFIDYGECPKERVQRDLLRDEFERVVINLLRHRLSNQISPQ